MSAPEYDGKSMTEREVRIARLGYAEGYEDARSMRQACAAQLYPLPKVTRMVEDPHGAAVYWMAFPTAGAGRHIVVIERGGASDGSTYPYPRTNEALTATDKRVALWADLLANPTEEVEA